MTDQWWLRAACSPENRPAHIPGWIWTDLPTPTGQWGSGIQRRAVQICRGCPVRQECFEDVMKYESGSRSLRHGIWAGYTPAQRAAMGKWKAAA